MLSFGSASMLWWSLAAAIPFVLHLWNRKPRQIVPFAATRFLVAATKHQSRRIKFQQWILLLARVAILLLFALALAEPRWGTGGVTIPSGLPTHHLLVIDDSYSMQGKIDADTRLDAAKAQLAQFVRRAPSGDLFSLLAMGDPPEIVIAGPSHEREEIERAINQLGARPVSAKVAPALSVVNRIIEDSQSLGGHRAYRVTFASDLARNSWAAVTPEQIDGEFGSSASGVSWSMIETAHSPVQNNLAISQFRASRDIAYAGQSVSGTTEILNTGASDCESALVEIRTGDRVLFRDEISLKAGQQVAKPWRIEEATESLLLEARVDSDDLELDNSRYLSVEVRAAPRVLCVASSREAAEHITLALTAGPAETRPKVDLMEAVTSETLDSIGKLSDYDAIVLLNLPPPTGEFSRQLMRFVENGGGLLIGLGDRSARANATPAGVVDFYPAAVGAVVSVEFPRFDALDYAHPLLAGFRDAPEVGVASLPVWRYRKLEAIRPAAKIAARFGNGDPALVEQTIGRGRVVLFAGSLGAESVDRHESQAMPWSGLPGSAAYVPLIQEWVKRIASPEPREALLVGDVAPRQESKQDATIEYRNGDKWRPLASAVQTLDRPGFYRFVGEPKRPPFAVNLNAQESWYESDRARWIQWINAKQPVNSPAIEDRTSYRSLSPWLLIPLTFLICGEIVLATLLRRAAKQFGAPRRAFA